MKIYVEIYLDHNLGDDLFLDALLSRYPEHEFYIGVNHEFGELNSHFGKYNNLHRHDNIGVKNFNLVKNFDAYVLIGGSIYMDLNYKFSKLWISRYIKSKICKKNDIPFIVLGCNIGPINTWIGGQLIKYHLNTVTDVCVRDQKSFDLLKKWNLKSNYRLAPDIVFSYSPFADEIESNRNVLGISVINTSFHNESKEAYVAKLAEVINIYLNKDSLHCVRLFGFDGGIENDLEVINKVIDLVVQKDKVRIFNYTPDFELKEYLRNLVECEFIVCTRFHAMIIALKNHKRSFVISYSKKINSVLEDVNYKFDYINYENIDSLNVDSLVNRIVSSETEFNFCLDKKILENSQLQFQAIDDLVKHNE
jgi:colanic acid/amylovoran biosynthesis protein